MTGKTDLEAGHAYRPRIPRTRSRRMGQRRAAVLLHNRRVDRLQRHFEEQRKRPMESMVSWAKERGIFEDNGENAADPDTETP